MDASLHFMTFNMTEHDVIPSEAKNPDVFVLQEDGSFTPLCFVQDDTCL
ncbi:MAG: hypothetical protein HGB20_09410 [Chlorobiaceae bacterium]|nr:hypothetical protein [Chlorobiaceae bacterium]